MVKGQKMAKLAVESAVDAADMRRPDFHVLTGSLKAKEDDGGRPTVIATASSDAVDLEADRFTASALKQMKEGFVGRIIFLNHSYKVPADVFGIVESAELIKREGRLDLDLTVGVETNNPLAVQTYQYIVNGTKLGVSVGVIVTEAEKNKDEEEDERGRTIVDISGVIPLEASVVGIPANQTAWTREAVKSLFASGRIDFDADEIAARPWLRTVVVAEKEDNNMATKQELEDEARAAALAAAEAAIARAPAVEAAEAAAAVKDEADPDEDEEAESEEEEAESEESEEEEEEAESEESESEESEESESEESESESDEEAESESDEEAESEESEESESEDGKAVKAVWSTAFINKLPDSAFAVILAGGKKDDQGKTKPRSLRKLPHHGPDGKVDKPHLNNALSREPQTNMPPAAHAKAKAHLNKHAGKKSADFDDDVSADLAADELVNKMFSGFRILVNSLVKILINSELSLPDRQTAGDEVVEQYQAFVAETWNETIEELGDEDKAISAVNIDVFLHDALSELDGVLCDVAGYEAMVAKVAEIGDSTKALVEERDALRQESERKDEALKYLEQVIEAMMELPLPTVTANGRGEGVVQSLAERFPALDTRVVERMARYAPSIPHRS